MYHKTVPLGHAQEQAKTTVLYTIQTQDVLYEIQEHVQLPLMIPDDEFYSVHLIEVSHFGQSLLSKSPPESENGNRNEHMHMHMHM